METSQHLHRPSTQFLKRQKTPPNWPYCAQTGVRGQQNVRSCFTGPWRPREVRGSPRSPSRRSGAQDAWPGARTSPAFFGGSCPVVSVPRPTRPLNLAQSPGFLGMGAWEAGSPGTARGSCQTPSGGLCSLLPAPRGWGHPGQSRTCCVTLGKSLFISGLCPGAAEARRPGPEQADFSIRCGDHGVSGIVLLGVYEDILTSFKIRRKHMSFGVKENMLIYDINIFTFVPVPL